MIDLKKAIDAAIAAEYAAVSARHDLAFAFCEQLQPEEVADQVTARNAGQNRIIKLERLRDYYAGKGMRHA